MNVYFFDRFLGIREENFICFVYIFCNLGLGYIKYFFEFGNNLIVFFMKCGKIYLDRN